MSFRALVIAATASAACAFSISNTLGDGMVLQRAPDVATVWGGGTAGSTISTTFNGATMKASVGADGIWRQALPATAASMTPHTLTFTDGTTTTTLSDVLFGDVILCGGQSNMQYTPRSMAGMNNMTNEIAAADKYPNIRLFTVGQGTRHGAPLTWLKTIEQNWTKASAAAVGAKAWQEFSGVCWLFGRNIFDAFGGTVPIGLVSNNWGGTTVQSWSSASQLKKCNATAASGTDLYNPMIHPYTVGPMRFKGAIWYQGESNVGAASYYACQHPAMITGWRADLQNPDLWFGFIQIAGYKYGNSLQAGDLRQAELAVLQLPNTGMSTAIDTGDYGNIHPPDKQNPSKRLSDFWLKDMYSIGQGTTFPIYAGSSATSTATDTTAGTVSVTVTFAAGSTGTGLTTTAPPAATQSTTLGRSTSVPRNVCVSIALKAAPSQCGYPAIYGVVGSNTTALNATAAIGADGKSIVLTAPAPAGFKAMQSSYGRGSWPLTTIFNSMGLPVIPWFAAIGSEELIMEFDSDSVHGATDRSAGTPEEFAL